MNRYIDPEDIKKELVQLSFGVGVATHCMDMLKNPTNIFGLELYPSSEFILAKVQPHQIHSLRYILYCKINVLEQPGSRGFPQYHNYQEYDHTKT